MPPPDLDQTLKDLDTAFGKGAVTYLGSNTIEPVAALSTGCIQLDEALGIGGVPRGRIVEIFGPESSGKSTLIYNIFAQAQAEGGKVALIDTEHSFDPAYAQAIGMDTEGMLMSQPDYGEQGMEITDRLVKSGELDVVAVDSVAALTPRAVMEGQMGDVTVGLLARLMSQGLSKLVQPLAKTKTVLLFTNQIRMNVNTAGYGGSPETQPGGKAMRFYAAQRLDIRRIQTIKDSEKMASGIQCKVKVVKNKTAPPYREALFEIDYGLGISRPGSLLDAGLDNGAITKAGSYFSFGDERLGQGRAAVKQKLRDNPDLMKKIEEALHA